MFQKVFQVLVFGLALVNFAVAQNKNTKQTINKESKVSERFVNYVEEKEEYAIYEAIIKEKFGDKNKQIVVMNRKVGKCGFNVDQLYVIDELKKSNFSEKILEELNKDCSAKAENYQLKEEFFNHKTNTVLLTDLELEKFFYLDCELGWKNFYQKYPNSNGNMSLSRVGFNKEKNMAVVSFGNQKQCLDGYGQLIFLQKNNGEWKINKTQPTWVS